MLTLYSLPPLMSREFFNFAGVFEKQKGLSRIAGDSPFVLFLLCGRAFWNDEA